MNSISNLSLAVVIPSYKVKAHILDVINSIGPQIKFIYVIDDCCPEKSGDFVTKNCTDTRVKVLKNITNLGVGGAVIAGYKQALEDGADIIIKIDGDGQMDPKLIPSFIYPIVNGNADYTKGNRFYNLDMIGQMPAIRLFGNAGLSFLTKLSSGYWDLFDPTNGYTAIHRTILSNIPLSKISNRYFFETDMLFRLNIIRATVIDVPMHAKYGSEVSSLKISSIFFNFLFKHLVNLSKRIAYNYYIRDMSVASIELPLGLFLLIFGFSYGLYHWIQSIQNEASTPLGTIMIAAVSLLTGLQLILSFLSYDINSTPKSPQHLHLEFLR